MYQSEGRGHGFDNRAAIVIVFVPPATADNEHRCFCSLALLLLLLDVARLGHCHAAGLALRQDPYLDGPAARRSGALVMLPVICRPRRGGGPARRPSAFCAPRSVLCSSTHPDSVRHPARLRAVPLSWAQVCTASGWTVRKAKSAAQGQCRSIYQYACALQCGARRRNFVGGRNFRPLAEPQRRRCGG